MTVCLKKKVSFSLCVQLQGIIFFFAARFNLDLLKETGTIASSYSDGANLAFTYVRSRANLATL